MGTVDSGPLAGTTSFAAATFTPTQVETVFHYTGNLIIWTRAGTLTIRDRGVLDMGKGAYFEFQNVVAGTGAFAGAKGMLTSQGQFSGASFSGSITGKVCRPSRHHDHPGRHHDGDDEDDSAGAEDSATE